MKIAKILGFGSHFQPKKWGGSSTLMPPTLKGEGHDPLPPPIPRVYAYTFTPVVIYKHDMRQC